MSTATTWPGFVPVTDQRQTRQMAEQLADDFGEVTFEGGDRLTDVQLEQYRALALEQSERHDRHAQAHQRYADGHRARGERLAEQAAPVETTIVFGAAGPELVERKGSPAPPANARVDVAEAATRLGLSEVEAVVYLGLDGHMADDAGTYLASDVDAVKDAR